MHLADAFIQSDLLSGYTFFFFLSVCVPWELNPRPFALLTQCSTTEPQTCIIAHTIGSLLYVCMYVCMYNQKENSVEVPVSEKTIYTSENALN